MTGVVRYMGMVRREPSRITDRVRNPQIRKNEFPEDSNNRHIFFLRPPSPQEFSIHSFP